jgi:hypothetical protein
LKLQQSNWDKLQTPAALKAMEVDEFFLQTTYSTPAAKCKIELQSAWLEMMRGASKEAGDFDIQEADEETVNKMAADDLQTKNVEW